MSITALKQLAGPVVMQEIGVVRSLGEDGVYTLDVDDGVFRAGRAVSCLVEPEVGDEVLFAGRGDGDLFILAVLVRPAAGPTRLSAPGDVTFKTSQGKLAFIAQQGIDLVTSATLGLTAEELKLNARRGDLFIERLTYLGKKALTEVEVVKVFANLLDTVADRVSQKANRSFRFIEFLDQLRSKQVDYRADENMRLRGHNTLINATLLTKIDGDQVHIG